MKIKKICALGKVCSAVTLLGAAVCSHGQQASAREIETSRAVIVEKTFSDVVSAAASSDPADLICARPAAGSVVTDPPALSSTNGVLEVTFHYKSTVDAEGLTRYCYVYTPASGQPAEAPTLEVNPGDQLILHFFNDLAATASTASAHSMQGMNMQPAATTSADAVCSATTMNSSSTNLHFHGTNLPPVCHQDEVVHTLIAAQTSFDYKVQIPANEPTGAYWYHPHPHGFSEGQVIGGATGVILVEGIQDVNPVVANLPERVFVLRDQAVPSSVPTSPGLTRPETDLSINYVPITYPSYTPATIQTAPSEKEFWRVLNTSADTLIDLQVVVNGVPQPLQVVAVDGVPLTDASGNAATTTVTDYLMNAATRVEFVVTTPPVGATAQLVTLTHDNGPTGDADPGRPLANIVSSSTQASAVTAEAMAARLPAQSSVRQMTRFSSMDASTPAAQRTLFFSVKPDFSEFYITVDGQTPAPFSMNDPPRIVVTEGTTEQWTIQNRSTMDHSFHIHQLHFQTLAINGTPVNDLTRRDTVDIPHWSGNQADPYPSVTLLMDFRDPGIVGTFVYHCHILSHEDRGMMAQIQVLPGVTATTVSASPASASAGTSITLTASVAPTVAPTVGTALPTGTVTFSNGATALGTATLNSSGVATLQTTALPIGSNAVTAVYSGDSSFATSTATATTVLVTVPATTTILTSSAASIAPGDSITFTATVAAPAGQGTPTGAVTFKNGTATLGTAPLNASGMATYSTTTLPAGGASITAIYAGNASFAASSSAALPIVVQTPTTTTLASSATTIVAGASVTLTATVAATAGVPTGTVTFLNGATALGTGTLNSTGVATLSTATLPVGAASITAAYGGDATYAPSTSAAVAVTVNAVPPDFTMSASPASLTVVKGASGSSTLTITPAGGFNSAVTFACSGLPAAASCAFTPATVTPDGTHTVNTAVSIATTGSTAALAHPAGSSPGAPLYALVLPGLGALLGLSKLRRRLPVALRIFSVVCLAMLMGYGLAACGGGSMSSGTSGTPAGTSTVTITATSGATVHTGTVTLTVQ